ncbi:MAG: glutamate racemase [Candidatus Omnitrophica bacterium]|nr:glutamate racemase [Candidatus Omnitrophota bacterium]
MKKHAKRRTGKENKPIGVFDSGLGGLTVVREMRRLLPSEAIIYFGDIARLPYGIKSKEQILSLSIQNTLFLLKHKIKALVVACNSSSSAAYAFLKSHFNLPVVDVIEPAARAAVQITRSGKIGIIATQSTVASGAYEKALKRLRPSIKVTQMACPLFVPLVEEGWIDGKITEDIVREYLKPLKRERFDTLILGCTHYPLLKNIIQRHVGAGIQLVDSALPTAEKLSSILEKNELCYHSPRNGKLKIFVSDLPRNFVRIGERFLGEKLNDVKVVRESGMGFKK